MINPLSIATSGYLSGDKRMLSIATEGYLSAFVLLVITEDAIRRIKKHSRSGKFETELEYTVEEELLLIISIFMKIWH